MVQGRGLLRPVVILISLVIASCGSTTGPVDGLNAAIPEGPEIVVGAQDFSESLILAEVYGQALANVGYPVRQAPFGGYREAELEALRSGEINMVAEYAASMLEQLNGSSGEASADVGTTLTALGEVLAQEGLESLAPAPAQNTNVFVMNAERATELEISKLSDLAVVGELVLGGPDDCSTNPYCLPGLLETYEIDLADGFTAVAPGAASITALGLDAEAQPVDGEDSGAAAGEKELPEPTIDIAVLFSTSSWLTTEGVVVLEDDRRMVAAENITPVVSDAVVDAYGDPVKLVLNEVSSSLTTDELVEMNRQFVQENKNPTDIATEWLKANSFIG